MSAERSLVWESPIERPNASWMATALNSVGGIVSVQWRKVSSRGLSLRWQRLLNCMSSRSRESPHPKQELLFFSLALSPAAKNLGYSKLEGVHATLSFLWIHIMFPRNTALNLGHGTDDGRAH